ncbi:MAG: class I SAM-dependent methyltransferase [Nakamurella multipartita]
MRGVGLGDAVAGRSRRRRRRRRDGRWATQGLGHTRRRDSSAIGRHYDVSNEFYESVLGPSMIGDRKQLYPTADTTLEQAQEASTRWCSTSWAGAGRPAAGCRLCGVDGADAARRAGAALELTPSRQQADRAAAVQEEAAWAQTCPDPAGLDHRDGLEIALVDRGLPSG